MKYTEEERIDIGRQVYTRELTRPEAMKKYGVSKTSIDGYLLKYKLANGIPSENYIPFKHSSKGAAKAAATSVVAKEAPLDIEKYRAMSKEELIEELILSKANELRAKKGYEVKGAGANKEYISLYDKNTKS